MVKLSEFRVQWAPPPAAVLPGSAAWGPSWWTGRCSRAPASTLGFRLWACGRCCWRRASWTTVRPSVACCIPAPSQQPMAVWLEPVCVCFSQWTRSWASRTNTSSTASWTTSRRTLLCPVRRRGRRARRSCRTPCSSSRRSAQTPTWGWSWGSSTSSYFVLSDGVNHWDGWLGFIGLFLVLQPVWKNGRWPGDHLWRAAPHKGPVSPVYHCECRIIGFKFCK